MGVLFGYHQWEKHLAYEQNTNKEVCITSNCAVFKMEAKLRALLYYSVFVTENSMKVSL